MVIKLYIDYLSQPSRAVLAVCLLGKIPHEVVQTRLMKGQTRAPQFVKINPMAKVPAIIDTENNLQLAESHSIIRYLCLKYPTHLDKWYPVNDLARRAKIDEYMDFHHLNTRKCANLIFNSLFAKNLGIKNEYFNEEMAKKQAYRGVKLFNKHYLGENKFINGNEPTVADLSAFYEIQFLMLVGQTFEQWQKIREWMDRMSNIDEVKKANSAFIKVMKKRNPSAKL